MEECCPSCGSKTYFFLLRDFEDKAVGCDDCPEYTEMVMRNFAHKYSAEDED